MPAVDGGVAAIELGAGSWPSTWTVELEMWGKSGSNGPHNKQGNKRALHCCSAAALSAPRIP